MKRIKKGMTLLVTTIVLSFVVITTSVFSVIYFRYGQMNASYSTSDNEKMNLYLEIYDAYEHFLKDDEINGKKLKTDIVNNLVVGKKESIDFSTYIANFYLEDDSKEKISVSIEDNEFTLYSYIENIEDSYTLTILNFVRRTH